MQKKKLGRSDIDVSILTLGCNAFGQRVNIDEAEKLVGKALNLGITSFDTAENYGSGLSEEYLGTILKKNHRSKVVICTKFGLGTREDGQMYAVEGRGRRKYVEEALDRSLKRLKTDYVDIYNYHRIDPETPFEETLDALEGLVRAGKIRSLGYTDFPTWRVADWQWMAREKGEARFTSAEMEYSLVVRAAERDAIPMMQAHGIGLMAYFPLAAGLLSGKYEDRGKLPPGSRFSVVGRHFDRFVTDSNWRIASEASEIAKSNRLSLLELALAWLAHQPVVSSVIFGASRPEQIEQNVKAIGVSLPAKAIEAVTALK
jgi:aryl-alcohol dehydrogenase-like predicted oxidoreductase